MATYLFLATVETFIRAISRFPERENMKKSYFTVLIHYSAVFQTVLMNLQIPFPSESPQEQNRAMITRFGEHWNV